MSEPIRLTQYSHGAGCGCKISPKVLDVIIAGSGAQHLDPKLWVGNASRDDAAVYAVDESRGLVSTTDFFMPIVDDPYDFGRVLYDISNDPENTSIRRKMSRTDCKILVSKLFKFAKEDALQQRLSLWQATAEWAKSLVKA